MGTINKLMPSLVQYESQNTTAKRKLMVAYSGTAFLWIRKPESRFQKCFAQGKGGNRERPRILVSFLLNLQQCSCSLYISNSSWWHQSPHDYSSWSPTLHFTDCLSPVRASLISYPEPGIPQLSSRVCPCVSQTGVQWYLKL